MTVCSTRSCSGFRRPWLPPGRTKSPGFAAARHFDSWNRGAGTRGSFGQPVTTTSRLSRKRAVASSGTLLCVGRLPGFARREARIRLGVTGSVGVGAPQELAQTAACGSRLRRAAPGPRAAARFPQASPPRIGAPRAPVRPLPPRTLQAACSSLQGNGSAAGGRDGKGDQPSLVTSTFRCADTSGWSLICDLVLAELLDRLLELDLALVDLDALALQEVGDVARGDRAVERRRSRPPCAGR